MSDNLRADLLTWADILARGTGTVPAVDVAWKLRQLASPTTGPAPALATPLGVGALVRVDHDLLNHPIGDIGMVIGQAKNGPNRYSVMFPGDSYPFSLAAKDLEVVQGLTPQSWWKKTPAAPQAPAQPTDARHGLIDATHVVDLHRSTRCTGCNAADQWWCSCPEGYTPSANPAAREDTAPPNEIGRWNEGDIAYDRTGFVHRRYAQGWRTYPRATGVQYGDDLMEANLGPLVRLDAVPPGTSDVGALPRGFVTAPPDDYNDGLIPDLAECTVAGCTHIRWRDLDTCQFHTPIKGNVEVRRPSAPPVDGDTPTAEEKQ